MAPFSVSETSLNQSITSVTLLITVSVSGFSASPISVSILVTRVFKLPSAFVARSASAAIFPNAVLAVDASVAVPRRAADAISSSVTVTTLSDETATFTWPSVFGVTVVYFLSSSVLILFDNPVSAVTARSASNATLPNAVSFVLSSSLVPRRSEIVFSAPVARSVSFAIAPNTVSFSLVSAFVPTNVLRASILSASSFNLPSAETGIFNVFPVLFLSLMQILQNM